MIPHERHLIQLGLISYTVISPFLFLWFHKVILKQLWDWDFADATTIGMYLVSNVCAGYVSYMIQECGRC